MGRSLAPLQALGHRVSHQRATPFEDDDENENDCEAPGEPASVKPSKNFRLAKLPHYGISETPP